MPHYVIVLRPSLNSWSSTSSEDMSDSEDEILVSTDRPHDPMDEESDGDEVEKHKPIPFQRSTR